MPIKNINEILNLEHTIAKDLFFKKNCCWEVIPEISQFIINLGETLPRDEFEKIDENIWIAKSAKISKTSFLNGPLIIDDKAEIRHCAYIRGKAIIGKNAVVGNSTEVKNAILFDGAQVPHYNYVGDSVLGYKAHMGAGSITSNVKSDRGNVSVMYKGEKINTGLKKFGAIVGDFAEIGCNAVLNPGTIIGKNSTIYPLNSVRGVIKSNSIYKSSSIIIEKSY